MSLPASPPPPPSVEALSNVGQWEFADVGYDTEKKLWFLQIFNETNQSVGVLHAKSIEIVNGTAIQQQWKDIAGKPLWHVRERLFAFEPANFSMDAHGTLRITFENFKVAKKEIRGERGQSEGTLPEDFSYLLYAYHLRNGEGKRAPKGFVEFFDSNERTIAILENKWIVVEDVPRRSFGQPPNLRLRVERDSVARILITSTTVVILGHQSRAPNSREF